MMDGRWTGRVAAGTRQAVGLGWLAGTLEVAALTAGLRLPLSAIEVASLGLVVLLVMGAVGGIFGAVAGFFIHRLAPSADPSRAGALQLGLTAVLLAGFYLWQGAVVIWAREQPVATIAMALIPLGFGGVAYFNARYWLRRAALGRTAPVSWGMASAGLSLLVVAGAAVLHPLRPTGGQHALEGDRSLVLITLDGVRPDDPLPTLDSLVQGGVRFLDAVSPSPHSGPAHATALTGLHPLRHGVLRDGDPLPRGLKTIAHRLYHEGYATGAFVSTEMVGSGAGFDSGWRVFDDDLSRGLAGVDRVNLIGWVRRAMGGQASRAPQQTAARFLQWLDGHHRVPFLAWVQLTGPPAELDGALAQILDGLSAHGLTDEVAVLVAGSHGRLEPGERGPLRDRAIQIPMGMRLPGVEVSVQAVPIQVRLTDLPATALDWLGLDEPGETEGVSLLGYARGERQAMIWSSLVGLDETGRFVLGMRNNGLKYIRTPDGAEALYVLADDPEEQHDLSESQPATLEKARALMSTERAALERLLGREAR